MTEVFFRPRLTIRRAQDSDCALRILEKAERHCLIPNSFKSIVRMEAEVSVAADAEAAARSVPAAAAAS
jgi:hypothetical protein